jgi:hypothetical protein
MLFEQSCRCSVRSEQSWGRADRDRPGPATRACPPPARPAPGPEEAAPASPATASTADKVDGPGNAPGRANSDWASADSSPKLQPRVIGRVRRRSSRSRSPQVSTLNRRPSRDDSSCGGSSRPLAAASPMATADPFSRRQISATASAFSSVSSKPGAAAYARSTNRFTDAWARSSARPSRPGGRNRQRGGHARRAAAGPSGWPPAAPGQKRRPQLRQQRCRVYHILEVVQHQQQPPCPQVGLRVARQLPRRGAKP